MSKNRIRNQAIKMAFENPHLRGKMLPLIQKLSPQRTASDEGEEEAKAGSSKKPGGKFIQFMKEMGDEKVRNPDTGNDVKLKSLKGDRGKKLQHEKFEKWLASQEKSKGKSDDKGSGSGWKPGSDPKKWKKGDPTPTFDDVKHIVSDMGNKWKPENDQERDMARAFLDGGGKIPQSHIDQAKKEYEEWEAKVKSKGKSDEKGGKPPAKSEGTKDKGPDNKPSGGLKLPKKVLKGDYTKQLKRLEEFLPPGKSVEDIHRKVTNDDTLKKEIAKAMEASQGTAHLDSEVFNAVEDALISAFEVGDGKPNAKQQDAFVDSLEKQDGAANDVADKITDAILEELETTDPRRYTPKDEDGGKKASLRNRAIRMAFENPELREKMLPLIQKLSGTFTEQEWKTHKEKHPNADAKDHTITKGDGGESKGKSKIKAKPDGKYQTMDAVSEIFGKAVHNLGREEEEKYEVVTDSEGNILSSSQARKQIQEAQAIITKAMKGEGSYREKAHQAWVALHESGSITITNKNVSNPDFANHLSKTEEVMDEMEEALKPGSELSKRLDSVRSGFLDEDEEGGGKKASLRAQVIKLAHDHPELRDHLLPILKEARGKPWESALEWLGGAGRLKAMIGAKHFVYKGSNQISFQFPHKKQKHYCTITVSQGRTYDEYHYEMEIKTIREPRAKVVNVSEEEALKHGIRPGRHKLPPMGEPIVKVVFHQKHLMGEDLAYEFQNATGLRLSL